MEPMKRRKIISRPLQQQKTVHAHQINWERQWTQSINSSETRKRKWCAWKSIFKSTIITHHWLDTKHTHTHKRGEIHLFFGRLSCLFPIFDIWLNLSQFLSLSLFTFIHLFYSLNDHNVSFYYYLFCRFSLFLFWRYVSSLSINVK